MPYNLSDDALAALRAAFGGEALVFVLFLQSALDNPGGESSIQGSFVRDLSIEEYRSRYEPELSSTRVRELCAGGAFPDTVGPSGEVTPGVYKTSGGEWRITLAGIVERQRKDRLDGMVRRDREVELRKAKPKTSKGDASHDGSDAPEGGDEAETEVGGPSAGGPQSADRPGKDRWKQVLADRAES